MSSNTSILTVHQSCDNAVDRVVGQLKQAGLSVLRTFDLQLRQGAEVAYPCPVHGDDPCDCQMVVLLVYVEAGKPVTVVAHGDHKETVFSLVDTPIQRVDALTEAAIRHSMGSPG